MSYGNAKQAGLVSISVIAQLRSKADG